LTPTTPSILIEEAIHCKEEQKKEEDGGSVSSSRSNTFDLPADSGEETDPPREEVEEDSVQESLLPLEPSGPGNECTEVFLSIHIGR
jgi:hypothetical protein